MNRRPYTALSKTGLEIDRKDDYVRNKNYKDKVRKIKINSKK